jgi:hypothetical protein
MTGIGNKKSRPPAKQAEDKSKKPPPANTDDDYEDGDIATPKQDRCGTDDEPL